jgi:hypothetical protein
MAKFYKCSCCGAKTDGVQATPAGDYDTRTCCDNCGKQLGSKDIA